MSFPHVVRLSPPNVVESYSSSRLPLFPSYKVRELNLLKIPTNILPGMFLNPLFKRSGKVLRKMGPSLNPGTVPANLESFWIKLVSMLNREVKFTTPDFWKAKASFSLSKKLRLSALFSFYQLHRYLGALLPILAP